MQHFIEDNNAVSLMHIKGQYYRSNNLSRSLLIWAGILIKKFIIMSKISVKKDKVFHPNFPSRIGVDYYNVLHANVTQYLKTVNKGHEKRTDI